MKSTDELLYESIAKKQKIMASHASYRSREWVVSEEKIRWLKKLKWVWKVKDTSHWEEVFNHGLYNKHIAEVDAEINRHRASIKSQEDTLRELESSSDSLRASYRALEEQATATRKKIENDRNDLINDYRQIDEKARAFMLSELFNNTDQSSKISVEIIKSVGFDANDLAFWAIKNNDLSLFDLALHYSADCSNYLINEQTLLQQVTNAGKQDFVQKILARGPDLTSTLVNAVKCNDGITVGKLISSNTELVFEKFAGYTLLQLAIATKKIDVVQQILSIEDSVMQILTARGDSAFKIAVRSSNEQIIQALLPYLDINQEIVQLGTIINFDEMLHLQETRDTNILIELFKRKIMIEKESLLTCNEEVKVESVEDINIVEKQNALIEKVLCNDITEFGQVDDMYDLLEMLESESSNFVSGKFNSELAGLDGANLHITDSL